MKNNGSRVLPVLGKHPVFSVAPKPFSFTGSGAAFNTGFMAGNALGSSSSSTTMAGFSGMTFSFGLGGSNGGFLLYPNKPNNSIIQSVYQK